MKVKPATPPHLRHHRTSDIKHRNVLGGFMISYDEKPSAVTRYLFGEMAHDISPVFIHPLGRYKHPVRITIDYL